MKLTDRQYDLPDGYVLTVDCPSCLQGRVGKPCWELRGNRPPGEKVGYHLPRIVIARRMYELRSQQTRTFAE